MANILQVPHSSGKLREPSKMSVYSKSNLCDILVLYVWRLRGLRNL